MSPSLRRGFRGLLVGRSFTTPIFAGPVRRAFGDFFRICAFTSLNLTDDTQIVVEREEVANYDVAGERHRPSVMKARADVTDEQERIATAMQGSLAVFARLREQMREEGPNAVAASLNSIPESDVRQILFALVVTTERVEEEKS
jgi:hypothetical protein